jgi:hypothetical protein
MWINGGEGLRVLKLCARRVRVVNFTLRPFYVMSQYALDRRVRAGQDVVTKRRVVSLPRITPACPSAASLLAPEHRTVLIEFVPCMNFADV